MGLCASMLPWKAKREQPEPRRSTPKTLFVVRNNGRLSKPEALVFHPRSYEKCGYECTDVLTRRLCAPKPPRIPCGSTRSVAVEPMAADEVRRPPVSRGTTADAWSAAQECKTPMTPRRTPLWQRRILMGTRCELPRFSGLILYDEHGRPLQSSSHNRADHLISRASTHDRSKVTNCITLRSQC
jgi:hypothetical protein